MNDNLNIRENDGFNNIGKYKCASYHIVEKKAVSAAIYSYELLCPEVAEIALPGQFVHIKIEGFILRRPISICEINVKSGTIRIVFEIRGEGTEKLSQYGVGDNIDMIAPLGNGFTLPEKVSSDEKIFLVGGGIGVPPLYEIAKRYKKNVIAILGFRSYDKIILSSEFKQTGAKVIICTDDGSVGEKAFVNIPLKKELEQSKGLSIYSCGPQPMLKTVIDISKNSGIPCQVSLEERMGCGVGACVCCTSKILRNGQEQSLRVCKDGPVFDGNEVCL